MSRVKPIAVVLLLAITCLLSAEGEAQSRKLINDYLLHLEYDAENLLALPLTTSGTTLPGRRMTALGVIVCSNEESRIDEPLTRVLIFNSAGAAIFPGALVLLNKELAMGRPQPVSIPRAPVTLSIDLPGLGDQGKLVVENPTNADVRAAINRVLERWNTYPASQGYVNAARSDLTVQKAYSRDQLTLGLGFNAQWASGEVLARVDVKNTAEQSTAVALFRQVFYTVSMNTPAAPADVFDEDVTIHDVKTRMNTTNPPGYVSSVDYGRLILVRMDTQSTETEADVVASLSYAATGGTSVGGDTRTRFERIIQNSTFTVVTVGGNAADATKVMGANALAELPRVIRKDAVYSRDNPGVPIAYTVHALRDNRHAAFHFGTKFNRTNCQTFPNSFVRLRHAGGYVAWWEVDWLINRPDGAQEPHHWKSGETTAGWVHTLELPGDAHTVRIRAWAGTGLPGSLGLREAINVTEPSPTRKTYRITGTTLGPGHEVIQE